MPTFFHIYGYCIEVRKLGALGFRRKPIYQGAHQNTRLNQFLPSCKLTHKITYLIKTRLKKFIPRPRGKSVIGKIFQQLINMFEHIIETAKSVQSLFKRKQ